MTILHFMAAIVWHFWKSLLFGWHIGINLQKQWLTHHEVKRMNEQLANKSQPYIVYVFLIAF